MMLTVANTIDAGRRCAIYDAEGREVELCVAANTKTGWTIRLGGVNKQGTDVVRIKEVRPRPLRVEWLPTQGD